MPWRSRDDSSTIRQRLLSIVLSLVVAGAVIGVPTAANAEPAGCWHTTYFWTQYYGAGQLLQGESVGECNLSAVRTLRVQIKSNQWPSDIVITSNDDHHLGYSYDTFASACDGGATHEYYSRGYYTQSVTWVDAGYTTHTTCS